MPQNSFWKFSWIVAVLLSVIVFFPSVDNGWLNWDDGGYVLQNPLVKSLNLDGLQAIFSEWNVVGNYHPITVVSLAIDYAIGEFDPTIYHSHNLFLHLLNTALIFSLLANLFKNYRLAFIVAMLFGIHPMHVESVAWISARKDLLFSFFLILAMHAYLYFLKSTVSKKRKRYYLACLVFFILSVLSKPLAIVFPVYLLLFDYLRLRKLSFKLGLEKVPFVIVSFLFVAITFYTQHLEGAIVKVDTLNELQRIAIACYAVFYYFFSALIPIQLCPFHPYPFQVATNFPITFYFSLVLIPLLWFIVKFVRSRNILFCILFFLVSLLPILQIVPIGRAMVAERYTYLAYVGVFTLIAIFFDSLLRTFKTSKAITKSIYLFIFLLISTLSWISYNYIKNWKSGETLWSKVIKTYPNNYFGYYSRADYYFKSNQFKPAFSDVNKSISLHSNYTESYNLRGQLNYKSKNINAAISDYKLSIKADSSFKSPYLNIAQVFGTQKQYKEALTYLNLVIDKHPQYSAAILNRAVIYDRLKKPEQALINYNEAINLDSSNGLYYRYRGVFHLVNANFNLALSDFNKSIQFNPNDGMAYFLRSKSNVYLNELGKALEDATLAKKLNYPVDEKYFNEIKILKNKTVEK